MPHYRVVFVFELGENGWTETYYRRAENAVAATDFTSRSPFLIPWHTFRVPSARLAWVRAQEEGGLRRVHLRRVDGGHGHFDRPRDLVPLSARVRFPMLGGGHRDLYLRGLADQLIRYHVDGSVAVPTRLGEAIENIGAAVREWGLRGRRRILHEKHRMFSVGPNADFASWTTITTHDGWLPPVGERVYFGGPPHVAIDRERGYLVTARYAESFAVAHPWPLGMAEQPYRGWARLLEYEYPNLGEPVFADYTRHVTGKRYVPATWVPDWAPAAQLHPCGRVVDVLRTNEAYKCGMRFFELDPDLVLPVRWEFFDQHVRLISRVNWTVEAGAPVQTVPYEHPFASRAWDLADEYETRLGETYARKWHRGKQTAVLSGRGLAGSRRAWEQGIDFTEPQVKTNPDTLHPCPCGPGVPAIRGGAAGAGADPAAIAAAFAEIGGAAGAGLDLVREPPGVIPKTNECVYMPLAPVRYALEITGATDAYMLIVGEMNKTHVLEYDSGCRWKSALVEMYNPQNGATLFWAWTLVARPFAGSHRLELTINEDSSVVGLRVSQLLPTIDYAKPIDLDPLFTTDFFMAGLAANLVAVPVGSSHTVFGGAAGAGWDFDPDA